LALVADTLKKNLKLAKARSFAFAKQNGGAMPFLFIILETVENGIVWER